MVRRNIYNILMQKKIFFWPTLLSAEKSPFENRNTLFSYIAFWHILPRQIWPEKKFLWKPNSPIACNIESIFYFSKKGLIGCKCTFLWNFDHFFAFFGTFYSDTFCHAKYDRKKNSFKGQIFETLVILKVFFFFQKKGK